MIFTLPFSTSWVSTMKDFPSGMAAEIIA